MAAITFDTLKDLVTKEHLDYKLAELKTDLIKWVVGLALAQSGFNALRWRHLFIRS